MVGTALDLSSAFSSGELDHSRGYWLTPSPVSVSSSNSPIHLSWLSDRAFRAYQSTLVNSNRPDCHGGSLLFPSPPPTCAERRPYAAETTVVVGSCLGVGITGHISARTVIWKTGLGPALSGGTTTVSLQILSSDSLLIAPSCHPRLLILSLNQQVMMNQETSS